MRSGMGQRRRALTPEKSAQHLLGTELRALRDRNGLSLTQLAARIYYDASHLGKYERGERLMPLHIAKACDELLGARGELTRLWAIARAASQEDNAGNYE